jgi:hypothetical protein
MPVLDSGVFWEKYGQSSLPLFEKKVLFSN